MNKAGKYLLLILCLILSIAIALFIGAQKISILAFLQGNLKRFERVILFDIRLPRILLCILCGALLGGAGAVFQGFFRNPLADSGILGISAGATLGALVSGLLPFTSFLTFKYLSPVSIFAFIGGLGAGALVFIFSLILHRNSSVTLLLAGTAIGTFLSSVCSILLMVRQKDLHSIYAWTMGSFNGKGWDEFYFLIIPAIVALILLLLCAKNLNVLGSGEKTAVSLGLNLSATKIFVLISGSLATSCAVCAGGIISFVGLISPHIIRKLFGSDHHKLIPLSMIGGAILLLLADSLARTVIAPSEIPVGIITSLIGVPFFIIVLKKD